MLKFAILEDNEKVLKELKHSIESILMQYDFDASIKISTTNVDKFINYIDNNNIDVVFLDINLNSYLTGIQIAEKIRKTSKDCYIIFETAHLEYSLIAYKYKVFDFISKPINRIKIKDCILRLFDDISKVNKSFIKLDNKCTIIAENDIKYIEKDGSKLIFHTEYRDYQIYSSFLKILDRLPSNFIRCHKSFVVNINCISTIDSSNNIVLFSNSFCEIGPKYKKDFLEVIDGYSKCK